MNKRLLQVFWIVSALVLPAGELAAATYYYVDRNHAAASDGNDGSETSPWKSIVHAAATAQAGDTVYIKAGTYQDGNVKVRHSGSPGNPITFAAFPGDERKAIIKGAAFISYGNSFITVSGLKIMDSPQHGILFEGRQDPAPPAQGIIITGNYIHNTCNAGIMIRGVPWDQLPGDYDNIRDVEIANNLVELGTNSQLATSTNKCRGEVISVTNGVVNVNVHDNEIRLGDPNMVGGDEGIDFKEGVRDSSIYHNYIHNLSDKAIYLDGGSANPDISSPGDPQVTNIHIYDNVLARLPSNGISVTTEGKGDVDGVYIYNNIAVDVDKDGFLVYKHPGGAAAGGTVNNVYLIHNTAIRGRRGISVNHKTATGILIQNNIAWDNRNRHDIHSNNGAGTTYLSNLCLKDPDNCSIQADPQFIDAANNDFRLAAASPAIDQATAIDAALPSSIGTADIVGTARPQGSAADIGAHEYTSTDTENPIITISRQAGGYASAGSAVRTLTQSAYFYTGFDDDGDLRRIPSIDPAGLVFHGPSGHLIVTDSEINEVPAAWDLVQASIFDISSGGTINYNQDDLTRITGNEPVHNKEPTGIAYCPGDDHFYVTNDDNDAIYRYTYDGTVFTADDFISTRPEGYNPQGITCDPDSGRLYVIDSTAVRILTYTYDATTGFSPGNILDLNITAGNSAGIPVNPRGITFDPISGNLFVVSGRDKAIFEYNTDGVFINKHDISGFVPRPISPEGLAIGPSSTHPGAMSMYISDAGIDNDQDPSERDGTIYEALIQRGP